MAEEQLPSSTLAEAEAQAQAPAPASTPAATRVNLQILSPSVGVNTLNFRDLQATTTVGQLKDKIRDILPLRPAHDHQRLIHRGRLLARDNETLQDVFGEEVLRTSDQQTLHLVVRTLDEHDSHSQTPSRGTPVRGMSPAPGGATAPQSQPQTQPHPHHHHHHHHQHTQHRVHPLRNTTPGLPNPAVAQIMQLHQQNIQQHQQPWLLVDRIQREAAYRQILVQQQRERAAMGYHGVQDTGNGLQGLGNMDPLDFRHTGVEGLRRRMAPNEATQPGTGPTSNPSRGTLTPAELQNILRGADTTQATQTITNAMHRSASGASLASMANFANFNGPIQPIQPGVTTPLFPGGSRHASRAATPDPSARPASRHGVFMPFNSQSQAHTPSSLGQPEVYILSSPTGPRGLLINSNSEMYVTPPVRPPNAQQFPLYPPAQRPQNFGFPHAFLPHIPNPPLQPQPQATVPPQQLPLPAQQQGPPQPQPPQVQVRVQRPPRPIQAHPNNPGVGALVAAAWPHVWLIIRLVIFVWWFTSSDASWSRWLAMVAIAIIVFIVNTGVLDGAVNQAWNPLRQHLEGLLPLGNNGNVDPPPRRPQPPPGFPNDPNDRDAGPIPVRPERQEPDPAQAAARLVAMRRHDNTNWLLDQVRRVERAGLLFIASIAPGVAERHIAHLEAQARARREAEEAAAAAAEAARAAAEAAAAAAAAATESEQHGDEAGDLHSEGQDAGAAPPQQQQPAPPPLVEI